MKEYKILAGGIVSVLTISHIVYFFHQEKRR